MTVNSYKMSLLKASGCNLLSLRFYRFSEHTKKRREELVFPRVKAYSEILRKEKKKKTSHPQIHLYFGVHLWGGTEKGAVNRFFFFFG